MTEQAKSDVRFGASMRRGSALQDETEARGTWTVTCRRKDGSLKWQERYDNLVVDAGLNYLLDAGLSGGSQITSWYVGLISDNPTVAAADTLASHSGWTEFTAYDEAGRQAWTDGGVSSKSVSNSGNAASFTCSTNGSTVAGAFLASDDTKGGTNGTLYAAGTFASDKSLDDGDTLEVTATFTQAAAS